MFRKKVDFGEKTIAEGRIWKNILLAEENSLSPHSRKIMVRPLEDYLSILKIAVTPHMHQLSLVLIWKVAYTFRTKLFYRRLNRSFINYDIILTWANHWCIFTVITVMNTPWTGPATMPNVIFISLTLNIVQPNSATPSTETSI